MTNNKTFRRFDMFIRVLFFPEFFNYPHRRRRLYFSDFISFLIQLLSNNDKAKGCGGRKKKTEKKKKNYIITTRTTSQLPTVWQRWQNYGDENNWRIMKDRGATRQRRGGGEPGDTSLSGGGKARMISHVPDFLSPFYLPFFWTCFAAKMQVI